MEEAEARRRARRTASRGGGGGADLRLRDVMLIEREIE